MKTRQGFVSNSSTSSFVIPKNELNPLQLALIINHAKICGMLGDSIGDLGYCFHEYDGWNIEVTDDEVIGNTMMDNFDMYNFMESIGVKTDRSKWDRWG